MELREVRDPTPVGHLDIELAVQQIRRPGSIRLSETPLLAAVHARETTLRHESRHAVTADATPMMAQLAPDPRRAVSVSRALVDGADLNEQLRVGDLASRGPTRSSGVVGRARDLGDWTEVAHFVIGLVVVDETAADHRIVSLAK